jgi:predicted Zn-dependent peptidase
MSPRRSYAPHLERTVLDNGLRVVVAPDRSSPLVGVAVVYDVGFRSEPEGRTGFAHLFEHLMFQGSENVAKVEHHRLIEASGGLLNGHTQSDITCYYEVLPSGALELALWLEADRMSRLALDEENLRNQVSVVQEEIKVNVLNRPYGGFPWIPLPALAFDTFPNAHNGYGDFSHLEQATLEDAADFYATFYAPSNAVLVVVGDTEAARAVELAERHFGGIPPGPPVTAPDFAEPPLARERRQALEDRLAPQPAFVAGYRVPDPVKELEAFTPYVVLAHLLAEGEASRLRTRLVHADRLVTDVSCMIGTFGSDTFSMRDPILFQVLVFHPGLATTDALLEAADEELARLAADGPSPDELERVAAAAAASHWRGLDELLGRTVGFASVEVVHGRAELVGELPDRMAAVGGDAIAAAAADLLAQHRCVLELVPGAGARS